jgi:tetratricopeptide (TPR) repeat protein
MRKSALGLCLLLVCVAAFGQGAIRLPDASPAATVGQTIGVTDVNITYHRPAVNKRKIFGGLVSYDTMWRAGANENTTITFSTPVKVEGHDLAAGTYALYMIPTASQWTVVLSKFTGDWGAYNYDQSEDALRVTVTPQNVGDSQERLAYTFDDVTNSSATASLRWEKLRVPVKIEVDLPATVRASIANTLRGGKHWDGAAWAAAARWELRNGDADTALKYANHALELGTNVPALRTKAAVLEKKGDAKGAAELRDRAKSMYTEAETLSVTYNASLGAKKYDEAISYLNGYIAAHPNGDQLWRAYSGLGEAYSAKGDAAKAKESFDKAMSATHDNAERTEVWDSINAVGAGAM